MRGFILLDVLRGVAAVKEEVEGVERDDVALKEKDGEAVGNDVVVDVGEGVGEATR